MPEKDKTKEEYKAKSEYIEFAKVVEGFEPRVYTDAAGHLTIGYGHKLTDEEKASRKFMDGLSEPEAAALLEKDIFGKGGAYRIARQQFTNMFGTYTAGADSSTDFGPWNTLSEDQKMMITDYGFNLGSIRDYPNLMLALLEQDWGTVAKEYKRTVGGRQLGRNEDVYNKYIAPHLDPASSAGTIERVLNY